MVNIKVRIEVENSEGETITRRHISEHAGGPQDEDYALSILTAYVAECVASIRMKLGNMETIHHSKFLNDELAQEFYDTLQEIDAEGAMRLQETAKGVWNSVGGWKATELATTPVRYPGE